MAKSYEIEGTVHLINDIQTFDSGFSKREFVIEVEDGKYPQMLKFEAVKDKTSLTDNLSKGDAVKVFFDIRGNEYNGRYFVNLNAWKLEKAGSGDSGRGGDSYSEDDRPPSHLSEPPAGFVEEEDIPF
jgi:single-strand DNA-binding protein